MSYVHKRESWHFLEAAIRRLDARRRLYEASIELASLDLLDAKDELDKLQIIRRKWKVGGRPQLPVSVKRIVADWKGREGL